MTTLATHPNLNKQMTGYATHEVMNQPGALEDHDLYSADKPLRDAKHAFGAVVARGPAQAAVALIRAPYPPAWPQCQLR